MIIFLFLFPALFAQNLRVTDSVDILNNEFGNKGKTFFCQCPYFRKYIDLGPCKFKSELFFDRQKRVEWSPIVPLDLMAKSFSSFNGHENCKRVDQFPTRSRMRSMGRSPSYFNYTTTPKPFKGIDCVRKVDELFRRMENDLYNIVPVIGSINALKKDAQMAEVEIFVPQFGACDLKIINNLFSPPPALRGDVARTFFYMNNAYPGRNIISKSQEKLFKIWDKMDPVSPEECKRAYKIQAIQGNENPYIVKFCR